MEKVEQKKLAKKQLEATTKDNKEARVNTLYTYARDLLNARRVEHGVADFNLRDVEGKLLWPLDSLPREKIEIKLVDMNDYEDINQDAVKGVLKKYGRLFNTYFHIYLSGAHRIGVDNPDESRRIAKSSLWKFMKDYKLDYMITLDDVSDIVRLINSELMDNKGEIMSLDYAGFKHFLIQVSLKCFTEAANLPPSFALR